MPADASNEKRSADAGVSAPTFVSAGGVKLAHALRAFEVDARGLACVDLGCSTGGFTDCLLQAGAARVAAIDTAYGELAWSLRRDSRVALLERTNALRAPPPKSQREKADLVVVDLGWTRQALAIPAALGWLKDAPAARIITLIKPQYEAKEAGLGDRLVRGALSEADARLVMTRVLDTLSALGVETLACAISPVVGGSRGRRRAAGGRRSGGKGNIEFFALLRRAEQRAV